ncbi:MAG: dockerin type I repeat-containing protein [Prevotella sp.]|nr:dockerin type I repeat-containing protein [Prevotella sp.]
MKKLLTMLLAIAALAASADNVTYNYLVMKQNEGTLTPLSVVGLELTFSDGLLHATCADGDRTFTLASLASMFFSETATPQPAVLLGDANDDGVVNVADYVAVSHHITGNTPVQWNVTNADVNGDGRITVADYIGIVHIVLNQSTE